MLTLSEIKRRLRDLNISEVAREIGMTRQQLWLIANGQNGNPTIRTIEKISNYLEGVEDADA